MTIKRTSVDAVALPTLLLPLVKAQARVEHARDDELITGHIAAAIGIAERKCNVSINPAEYVVSTDELHFSTMPCPGALRPSWRLPLNNVRECAVVNGADDLSAKFELWSSDPGGNASTYLVGIDGQVVPTPSLLSLKVGVEAVAELAPAFVSLIARLAASMYENREASSALWVDGFTDELGGLWRPDV
jgi:hypothetical protein